MHRQKQVGLDWSWKIAIGPVLIPGSLCPNSYGRWRYLLENKGPGISGNIDQDQYRTLFSFDRYRFLLSWDSTSLEVLIPGPKTALPKKNKDTLDLGSVSEKY